jgi:uracil phosphoribosyltransferase
VLIHHTDNPLMRLAVDKTRRKATQGADLAAAHREIGRLLAPDVARNLELEDCAIEHSTGPSTGVQIRPGQEPAVVAMMRAGLFVAEGVWDSLPGSALVPWRPKLEEMPSIAGERPAVIVDSVINTGRSMKRAIEALRGRGHEQIVVVTLVAYRPTLAEMAEAAPDITFIAARLSERSYVGSGGTDTGARLFGTTGWEG